MLAYAAKRPAVVDRRPHPNALLAIIAVHVALLAVVMSAKMDLPRHVFDRPPKIFWVPKMPDPPPPNGTQKTVAHQTSWIDHPSTHVKVRTADIPPTGAHEGAEPKSGGGPEVLVGPEVQTRMEPLPASSGPLLVTPASELKPPYPPSKLLNEEEASLTLKLTIDDKGRVVAVAPVGRADAAFLEAARRHLLAHWRYKPASEGGRPVASSAVITLRFELNG